MNMPIKLDPIEQDIN